MKELKNKEIIIGLAALIVLCILAIVLIVKRESDEDMAYDNAASVEEFAIEEEYAAAEASEPLQASLPAEPDNLAITEEESQTEIAKGEIISTTKVGEVASFHTEPKLRAYKGEDMWQMEEIYYYWAEYKLDAVDDLIHLPRVRMITNELRGSNDFYYYGQTDGKGNPPYQKEQKISVFTQIDFPYVRTAVFGIKLPLCGLCCKPLYRIWHRRAYRDLTCDIRNLLYSCGIQGDVF
jgi:hypothetical protein